MKPLAVAVSLLAAAAWAKPVVLLSAPKPLQRAARAALSKAQVKPLGADLETPPSPKSVRDACAPAKADAVVQLVLGRKLTIVVSRCTDGEVEAMNDFPAPRGKKLKKLKKFPRNVQAMVGAAVAAAARAPNVEIPPVMIGDGVKRPDTKDDAKSDATADAKPDTKPDEKPDATADATPADDGPPEPTLSSDDGPELSLSFDDDEGGDTAQAEGRPAVVVGVGGRAFRRSYDYKQDTQGQWGTYSLPVGWAVSVDAAWYPGAHVVKTRLADLGLFGQADLAVGLKSRQDSIVWATDAERFRVGVMGRLPVSVFTFEGRLGWARNVFAVAPYDLTGTTPRPRMPDIALAGPRATVSVRFGQGAPFWAELSGSGMLALDVGEIAAAEYFPGASAFSWDAQLAVLYKVTQNLAARATFDAMNATIDTKTAFGPATEWNFGGALSMVWVQ